MRTDAKLRRARLNGLLFFPPAVFVFAFRGLRKAAGFFVLCAVLANPAGVYAAAPPPPTVAAESYILMDAETGEVLAEKNADLRLPPASLTKIMSAHLVFNALRDGILQMEQTTVVSRRAWAAKVAGSKTFIEVGDEVSVRDLLYGVIVQSGNDAAIALAEALSGDEAAFAEWMNLQARELNLTNTNFTNATGLPDKNLYSSARDIALVTRATVNEHPLLYKIYAEREFTYNNITQKNRNNLLGALEGADGVKTGYTKAAGFCLASSAARGGQRFVAVVMKAKSARARARASAKLLNYGFSFFRNRRLFDETKTRELPVYKGERDAVRAKPSAAGLMTVPRTPVPRAVFYPRTPLLAPVGEGDTVGEIRITAGGEALATVAVVAAESVGEAGFWRKLADDIKLELLGHGEERRLLAEW